MNIGVIGCGAAGNKAVDALVENGYSIDNVLFVNSTPKDIPEKYRDRAKIFGSYRSGGCGKERTLGKNLLINDMKNGDFNIDSFITPTGEETEFDLVILASSTEGGSGSASLPILAKYIKSVHNIPVICVLFFGFGDDARGYQNSIEICQELDEDYGIVFIQNTKFLQKANNNKLKAEQLANIEFVNIIRGLNSVGINPSSQNIDDTDMMKVIVTPGFLTVDQVSVEKFKNTTQYNEFMNEYLDNTTAVDAGRKSAKRIAVFFSTDSQGIDFSCSVFKDRFGNPYELFTHVQAPEQIPFIRWIASGQKMPIDEIKSIYEKYAKESENVDKDRDSFFDELSKLKGNSEDNMFNMVSSPSTSTSSIQDARKDFFSQFSDRDDKKHGKDIIEY